MVEAAPLSGDSAAAWRAEFSVALVHDAPTPNAELLNCLRREGVQFARADADEPSAVVLDLVESDRVRAESLARANADADCPVIAALSPGLLLAPDLNVPADDFIAVPWPAGELALRIRRRAERAAPPDEPGVIRAGDLVINPARYDVHLAGKPVVLAFKEYELLKTLAASPGRVFTRETLLEQVWGYKYFGGTRTVDVHVRRLRSKIEDAAHAFIETVWNVGYRFKG